MSRPGFVIEVDEKTPALLALSGQHLGLSKLGQGTQVVYPAEATPSTDPTGLIDSAIEAPNDGASLASRLKPETKLTIVVLDDDRPRPRMRFDIRRSILERVLEVAAKQSVDDVAIVIAGGLHKRWSPFDITRALGDRVATSFQPDGLIQSHDITDENLAEVGEVDGHSVKINRRVAESDVVISIGTQFERGGSNPFTASILDVDTLRKLGGPQRDDGFGTAVDAMVLEALDVFAIHAVLGQPLFPGLLRFASEREWEWSLADRASFAAVRQFAALMPKTAGRRLHSTPLADYAVIDVVGGAPAKVFNEASAVWEAANIVDVPKQADVVVTSVWGGSFDEGDACGSPINAANHALVRRIGATTGTPYAHSKGVAIAMHPLAPRFSNRRQSAASDFFAKVLPSTLDPAEMHEFEEAAVRDQWYKDLYRKQFADHPLRTFQTWYRVFEASAQFGDVIWVGGDRRTADLFGHRAATTFADALEMASDKVGRHPVVTYLRGPGLPLGDVR
ncbi:MAG: lactate racemase domain-containing protein [Propionibacteriaceae bacterium]|nr:lactate racemase domain-containing protein [Propionibacteriaceae bacterium]